MTASNLLGVPETRLPDDAPAREALDAGSPAEAARRETVKALSRAGEPAIAKRPGSSTAVSWRSSPKRSRMRASGVGMDGTWKRTRRRS